MNDATPERPRIKYTCWNPWTKQCDEVFPESEIADGELVIPLFWVESFGRYLTVPGTEFYGPVPPNGI